MNLTSLPFRALLVPAFLACSTVIRAANPAVEAATPPLITVGASTEVGLLQQVYGTLAVADHDYKGHRVKAMKAIEAACKLLGGPISGNGKGHEKQALSDAQLRQAIAALQQAQGMAAANGQKKVLNHIDTAIKELNIALTIR